MLAGHYGVALGAKEGDRRVPLWALFLAVMFLDLVWSILILLGVEKADVVHGVVAGHSLDFTKYPYSHSLVAALAWSLVAYALARRLAPPNWRSSRSALVVAGAVFSHWVCDLVVHQSDLPLWGGSPKVGLDLWQSSTATFIVESALVAGGLWLYLRATKPVTLVGRLAPWALGALLVLVALSTDFSAATNVKGSAAIGLVGIALLPALAQVAERGRRNRRPAPARTAPRSTRVGAVGG